MPASNGRLTADVTGEVETEEGVLVIRRVHVAMRLAAPEVVREKVERMHEVYAMHCPLFRTLHKAVRLTSSSLLYHPRSLPPPSSAPTIFFVEEGDSPE